MQTYYMAMLKERRRAERAERDAARYQEDAARYRLRWQESHARVLWLEAENEHLRMRAKTAEMTVLRER